LQAPKPAPLKGEQLPELQLGVPPSRLHTAWQAPEVLPTQMRPFTQEFAFAQAWPEVAVPAGAHSVPDDDG
jgi:hypothetical protein